MCATVHEGSKKAIIAAFFANLGIAIAKGTTLNAGENSLSNMKYTRCERDGCYVEVVIPTETLTVMSGMTSLKAI